MRNVKISSKGFFFRVLGILKIIHMARIVFGLSALTLVQFCVYPGLHLQWKSMVRVNMIMWKFLMMMEQQMALLLAGMMMIFYLINWHKFGEKEYIV